MGSANGVRLGYINYLAFLLHRRRIADASQSCGIGQGASTTLVELAVIKQ
jgi:hypothetical protein